MKDKNILYIKSEKLINLFFFYKNILHIINNTHKKIYAYNINIGYTIYII
jgi:hypothetical protein